MSAVSLLFSVLVLLSVISTQAVRTTGFSADKDLGNPENNRHHHHKWEKNVIFKKEEHRMSSVLTLDGGGLRALIIVEVLSVVENAIKKSLRLEPEKYQVSSEGDLEIDLADFFAAMSGVNSGSWIASYLASRGGNGYCKGVFESRPIIDRYGNIRPGSVDGLRVLFLEYGRHIYPRVNLDVFGLRQLAKFPFLPIPGVTFSRHPSRGLQDVMTKFLGETAIDEVHTILMIPAYDLIRGSSVLFVSGNYWPERNSPSFTFVLQASDEARTPKIEGGWPSTVKFYENKKYKLRTLVQGASSAAIMHPAVRFSPVNDESFEFYCIDSSLLANNPTQQTLIFYAASRPNWLVDVSSLSIGTGITGGSMIQHVSSGAYQWMLQTSDLFTVITDGSSELVQAQLDMFFYFVMRETSGVRRGQYLRIQTSADEDRPEGRALESLDDLTLMEELQLIGRATAATFRNAIDDFVAGFIFGFNYDDYKFSKFVEADPVTYSRAKEEEKKAGGKKGVGLATTRKSPETSPAPAV